MSCSYSVQLERQTELYTETAESQENLLSIDLMDFIPDVGKTADAAHKREDCLENDYSVQSLINPNNNEECNKSVSTGSNRSTRSKDNPEFVAKQKSFIARVQAATSGSSDFYPESYCCPETLRKRKKDVSGCLRQPSVKRKKNSNPENSVQEWQNDSCCWECHREGQFICCEMCPRVYHLKCARLESEPEDDWACSECHAVMQAENIENRSLSLQLISVDQLCILLKYALNRLQSMAAMEPFCKPVDVNEFPTYSDMIVHPVDFTTLERNIKRKFYGSTEAFLSDSRWIVHNSVIFNGANSKVTAVARTFIKILRQELSEIETCPDCYENAHQKPDSWFTEACRLAHPLVWARLKGFPFWPAKAVKWRDTSVDVRFFGRHDRSWVPLKECFLFSEQMPTSLKTKNKTLESCLIEVAEHISSLKEKFGKFKYAGHRIPFNPYDLDQIKVLIPNYKGPAILRIRSRTRSFSRQSAHSGTDDDTSSVASTDSGTSLSKRQTHFIKDRLLLNTPDTEPEYENITNDDDLKTEGCNKNCGTKEYVNTGNCHEDINVLENSINIIQPEEAATTTNFNFDKEKLSADDVEGSVAVQNYNELVMSSVLCKLEKETSMFDGHETIVQELAADGHFPVPEGHSNRNLDMDHHILKPTSQLASANCTDSVVGQVGQLSEAAEKFMLNVKPCPLSQKLKVMQSSINQKGDSRDLVMSTINDVLFEKKSSKTKDELSCRENTLSSENAASIINDFEQINALLRREENKDNEALLEDSDCSRHYLKIKTNIDLTEVPQSLTEKLTVSACTDNESIVSDSNSSNHSEENMENDCPDELCHDSLVKYQLKDQKFKEGCQAYEQLGLSNEENRMNVDNDSHSDGKGNHSDEGKIESHTSDVSDDKYFQGFSEEINLLKRVETYKAIFNNVKMSEVVNKDETVQSSLPASETDISKLQTSVRGTDDDDSEKFNEQLFNNSSLTVGKIKTKLVKVKKICSEESDMKDAPTGRSSSPFATAVSVSNGKCHRNIVQCEETRDQGCDEPTKMKDTPHTLSDSTVFDFKNYADKVFHNVTISSKTIEHVGGKDRASEEEISANLPPGRAAQSHEAQLVDNRSFSVVDKINDSDSKSDSLLEAVRLVQSIGNIAIKRVDNKTQESSSSSDRVTTAGIGNHMTTKNVDPQAKCKLAIKKDVKIENKTLAAIPTSVSVTKASEKEKVVMPSGVDTTRLSPSISIIPVAGSVGTSDKTKNKFSPSPPFSAALQNTSITLTTVSSSLVSPVTGSIGNRTSASVSTTPSIPPTPLLSSSMPSPTNTNVRSIFSPHLPGLGIQTGARTPITSPGLRMMTGCAPNFVMSGHITGPQISRHLPPDAGPLSCKLHKLSQKLAEMMRTSLEEVLSGLVTGTSEAKLATLQLELERCNWRHQQELIEIRHNADVMLVEIRANLEAEKQRAADEARRHMEQKIVELRRQMEIQMNEKITEVKRLSEIEKQRAVDETKKKQWCASCGKEALFFCCWNTSYCDYPCQQAHWPQHMSVCGQNTEQGGINISEGVLESVNGDMSCRSSSVSTPVQNLGEQVKKQVMEEEEAVLEDRRRKKKESLRNLSPVYADGLGGAVSPAGNGNSLVTAAVPVGHTSPMGQHLVGLSAGLRPGTGAPNMAAIAALAGASNTMKMPPRFMQHNMMHHQAMFRGMDPHMMMMMGRSIVPSVMMRGPMQPFRPRFM